jgi:galactofuranosylgalactofuranosylrhamnosyl-N-acetylglucosaminyl-diphospho-decaprenol beta-1,5/1,6-galactofuranosyltransferase
VVFDRPAPVVGLYLRARGGRTAERVQVQAGALRIPCGCTVSFDTYFNAFFEQPWRAHTRLGTVVLSVDAVGSFALRAFRRTLEGDDVLLEERVLADASGPVSVPLPPTPPGLNAASRLFFELTALPDGAVLRSAAWHSPDTSAEPVGLVAVFCTFDREPQLARVLATIGGDAEAVRALARVVVVSQGRPGLADHPGMARLPDPLRDRLEVIEQANFGGAGGFARGMLAATEVPGATHLVLMDDDVAAEPEGLRRAAAFFAIARPDLALGGHMLDLLQPTRLYEAGARIDPRRWYLEPLRMHLRLDDRRRLDELLDAAPMHYNGWWLFGLPLPLLDRAGLPLPCFIRGDDVEYGRRLHDRGLYTVGLPGVAIWHEPFYVKLGGWQLYYETRNMLVAAAVHFPRPAPGLAVLLLKRLLLYLLTYRYYSAALVLRAIEDYLRGPPVLEAPPQATHASLDRYSVEFPPAEVARERVAPEGRLLRDPRTLPGFVLRLVRAVLRNWAVPSEPASAPVRIEARDLVWFRVAKLDHVVAGTRWDARPPAFRRSRTAFRRLLARGVRLLLRVLREGTAAAEAWREAQPRLTSAGFWRGYLGLTQDTPAGAGGHRPWPLETRDACRPAAGEGAMGYRR